MALEITKDQIDSVLKGISIPPQPQIMVDLQMEQMSPHCDINEIAKLISQDVGLSGSIIKTVNSPFFKCATPVASINEAVMRLGVDSTVNLVNALSIKGEMSDEEIVSLGRFWDNAMEVASASTVIAKYINFPKPDEAYTLGLFHNAGIPLLMSRFDNYFDVLKSAYNESEENITDKENDALGTNHGVVGYYVAKSWKLPKYMCEAIHEHHRIGKVFEREKENENKKQLLCILKMAEHICGSYKIFGSDSTDFEWERIKDNVLLVADISDYDFTTLELQIKEMGLEAPDYY